MELELELVARSSWLLLWLQTAPHLTGVSPPPRALRVATRSSALGRRRIAVGLQWAATLAALALAIHFHVPNLNYRRRRREARDLSGNGVVDQASSWPFLHRIDDAPVPSSISDTCTY